MKYDEAYCRLRNEKLTIYEVRDLNFDETNDYDSDNSSFFCPDDRCREAIGERAKLAIVNPKKRKYKKTPHFRDTPSTLHCKYCPYGNAPQLTTREDADSTHMEGTKEHHFPTEFIPKRKKYSKKIQHSSGQDNESPDVKVSKPKPQNSQSKGKSTNRTSVLEHIVECYVSNINDKEILTSMPLKIEGNQLNNWSFFKKIKYFKDRSGLIYWGKIKRIKAYRYSFRIDFVDWVDNVRVCLYISKDIIDSYRKKRVFLEDIRETIQKDDEKYCFFYGIYPEIKEVEYRDSTFEVYNAEVVNIDHILIRSIES